MVRWPTSLPLSLPACCSRKARPAPSPRPPFPLRALPSLWPPQKPLQLMGHSRPITIVKYNADGDLLFTASKEASSGGVQNLCLWLVETGERIGTYEGHTGAVYSLDVTKDSKYLLTGSADSTARVWEALTGRLLATVQLKGPCHAVAWAEGEREFAVTSNKFMSHDAQVCVYGFNPDADAEALVSPAPRLVFIDSASGSVNYTKAAWMPANDGLVLGMDNGRLRIVDATGAGAVRAEWAAPHTMSITSMCFNDTKTLLVTGSKDRSATLWDVAELVPEAGAAGAKGSPSAVRNRYVVDVPVNGVALSSFKDHLILGGGQEARDVTTSGSAGKFEARFYDLVLAAELGRVKGHFGPINTLAFAPDGWGFCSGGEDGFVRLHKLDADYIRLGEGDDLDDPSLTTALSDGTYEQLEKEEEEELAKGKGQEAAGGGGS